MPQVRPIVPHAIAVASINVAGLSPGIYLVKVIMDNAEATARFIKE
tara:strand:- start:4051 stop:4188 length:138 start_codon:yes stop_codon:yes gene_type:complete